MNDLILNEEDWFKQDLLLYLYTHCIPPENVTIQEKNDIISVTVFFNTTDSIYCAWKYVDEIKKDFKAVERIGRRIVDLCVARNFNNE